MSLTSKACASLAVACLLAAPARAQGPAESFTYELHTDSGWVQNLSTRTEVVSSFTVVASGVPWMRLHFDQIELAGNRLRGTGAVLRITSHADGAVQELDADSILEWRRSSAYFNGDAVQVEILSAPRTGSSRVSLRGVTAGVIHPPQFTICGPTDDRVLSNDPRVARILPISCTAWLIDDCNHCMLTAGHCYNDPNDVDTAQFNVPLSLPNGTIQHPPPQDQYPVDPSSLQFSNGGLGSDWAYFGTFDNPTTGMSAADAQGAFFTLAPAAPAFDPTIQVRITGHGIDTTPTTHNRVQQTHIGAYDSEAPDRISYRADTTGGNSGSPVIWEQTGVVIGIHTNGGCTSAGGANFGTNIAEPGLQAALSNPQGVCGAGVSCGTPETYCTGKFNSLFCLPFITFTGNASASDTTPFQIEAREVLANRPGFMFYGVRGRNTLNFHGATLCVKAPLVRALPPKDSGKSGGGFCPGVLTTDFNKRIQSGVDPRLTVGAVVNGQFIYQDPGDPFGDGLTDGIEFLIGP